MSDDGIEAVLAEHLYRMNGGALYGHNLGDWNDPKSDIGGNKLEKARWLRQARNLITVAIRDAQSSAWDEGFEAGHECARAVNAEWPAVTRNPYREGTSHD